MVDSATIRDAESVVIHAQALFDEVDREYRASAIPREWHDMRLNAGIRLERARAVLLKLRGVRAG